MKQPIKNLKNNKEKDHKSSKIPYFFLAFFIVVVLVNVAYIYLSKQSWRGIISPDAYQKGLNYNETLKQAEEQKKLGWKVSYILTQNSENNFVISVNPSDQNNAQIVDAEVAIEFRRPSEEGYDFIQRFTFKDGVYEEKISFPLKGQWDFGIIVQKDGKIFKEVKREVLKW